MSIIHKGADTAKYSVALPIRLSDSLEADAVKTVAALALCLASRSLSLTPASLTPPFWIVSCGGKFILVAGTYAKDFYFLLTPEN
jgi:hypothetical protein